MLIGTSVGAINAAYLAGAAHLQADEASAGLLERWRELDKGAVIRPIIGHQLPLGVARYAAEILSLGDARLSSLLDPAPLKGNLQRWIDWPALHANVATGVTRAVAVVTTAACSGRTVTFVEGQATPRAGAIPHDRLRRDSPRHQPRPRLGGTASSLPARSGGDTGPRGLVHGRRDAA
jgi:NTE family protein